MKRLIALVLACLMALGGACLAAEWPQGRSAAQPYSQLPEVNLSETIGYIMLFPRAKLPASRFCNVLAMFLPREDLELGEGMVHLYEKVEGEEEPVEVCSVDFTDKDSVQIRAMNESELRDLMWGGGRVVEMKLSKSLEFGGENSHNYYVLMDPGCFTAQGGKLGSLQISGDEAWVPVIGGDYGVSGLYYIDAEPVDPEAEDQEEEEDLENLPGITDVVVEPEEEAAEEGDKDAGDDKDDKDKKDAGDDKDTGDKKDKKDEKDDKDDKDDKDAAAKDDGETGEDGEEVTEEETPIDPSQYVIKPDVGDKVFFDLVIGGDAVLAVLYSDNGSVEFDAIEYTQSGPVRGTVIGEDVQWGVAFYDANNYIFDTLDFSY